MIYLLTLLTLLSLGILIALSLKNMELKEQINKSLEENADNLSDQVSFQLESFAKTPWYSASNLLKSVYLRFSDFLLLSMKRSTASVTIPFATS